MTIKDIQEEILRLKKETDTCILAHAYQSREIVEIADYMGDSYGLSLKAAQTGAKNVIMCGVRFMAESVKMLAPEKQVYLPNPHAGCPMADQMDKALVEGLRAHYPGYTVVAYINTTAEVKSVCDVCVTSSSAVEIIRNIQSKDILFIPDCNLGDYIAKQLPDKNFKLVQGGCPTHIRANARTVSKARAEYKTALLLVHPECLPEVVSAADFVGSTTAIMDYAIKSDHTDFIIGTENSIVSHLQYQRPDKNFYPLTGDLICQNMKITTLPDVLRCLQGRGGEEIILEESLRLLAKRPIDEMIRLSQPGK